MTFNEYQKRARETAIYPDLGNNFVYPTLGVSGEAGELAEKIKKVLRDKGGVVDDVTRESIKEEMGDLLWYFANLGIELGIGLDDVAAANLEKISSRKERGRIHGNGDDR